MDEFFGQKSSWKAWNIMIYSIEGVSWCVKCKAFMCWVGGGCTWKGASTQMQNRWQGKVINTQLDSLWKHGCKMKALVIIPKVYKDGEYYMTKDFVHAENEHLICCS
jgi:hypothetical protein